MLDAWGVDKTLALGHVTSLTHCTSATQPQLLVCVQLEAGIPRYHSTTFCEMQASQLQSVNDAQLYGLKGHSLVGSGCAEVAESRDCFL